MIRTKHYFTAPVVRSTTASLPTLFGTSNWSLNLPVPCVPVPCRNWAPYYAMGPIATRAAFPTSCSSYHGELRSIYPPLDVIFWGLRRGPLEGPGIFCAPQARRNSKEARNVTPRTNPEQERFLFNVRAPHQIALRWQRCKEASISS
jgi:hypothetical protein